MTKTKDDPGGGALGPLDVNGWHGAARRVRHLQTLQAIVLVAASLASIVLILVLGRAILGASDEQRRASEQLRELTDMRATMLAVQVQIWRSQAEEQPLPIDRFVTAFADFRREAFRLNAAQAGGNRDDVVEARRKIMDAIASVDAIVAMAVTKANDPAAIRAAIRSTDGAAVSLSDGMDAWLAGATQQIERANLDQRSLSSRLLWIIVGVVGLLGLLGLLLWFGLDRARARLVSALQVSEERFRSLVQNSSDVVMVVDDAGAIRYASQPAQRLLGWVPAELVDMPLSNLVHQNDSGPMSALVARGTPLLDTDEPIEWQARHRDGSPRYLETLASRRFEDPVIGGFVLNSRDITDRKEMEATLAHRAFHDALTDLANRALFEDRVTHALEVGARQGGLVSVLLLDLDDFKTVNDSLGHAAGDTLLVEVARRLSMSLRTADTAARLGGDEFAILLETATSADEVTALAERLVEVLREPLVIDGQEIVVQGSIGIAIADRPDLTAAAMLRAADLAMYVAKERGRAGYAVFDPSMTERASDRLGLIADLHRALERQELTLAYQPIVDLDSSRITGVEALMRWTHPTRGAVEPEVFIRIAEETGLINSLGQWALAEATRQMADWSRAIPAMDQLHLAVNVSTRQLEQPGFVGAVRDTLAASDLPPHRLTLEITESALMNDQELMLEQLVLLKAVGVTIAIDDFGTGYSSLAYLARLPIDLVKIDRSFVEGLRVGRRDSRLASMIVGIGESLSLRTVAEGVELQGQVDDLRELGCRMAQGFYFARPLAADALEELLRTGAGGLTQSGAQTVDR